MLPLWQPLPASWVAEAAPKAAAIIETGGSAVDPAVAATSVPVVVDTAGSTPIVFAWSDLAPFLYLVPLALLFGVMLLAVVRLFAMRGRAEVLVQPSWLSALAEAQRRMGFKHGTALLVSDDTAGIIWRVVAKGAQPRPAIERIRSRSMPPQRELRGNPADAFGEGPR